MAGHAGHLPRALLAVVLAATAVLLFASPSGASAAGCPHANASPGSASKDELRGAIVCLVDKARTSRGGSKLNYNGDLENLAQDHTRKMVSGNCFTHRCDGEPTLKSRYRQSPYVKGSSSFLYAEELGYESTPKQMVARWIKQSGDRKNLLATDLQDFGVGVVKGAPEPGVADRKFVTYTVDLGALTH